MRQTLLHWHWKQKRLFWKHLQCTPQAVSFLQKLHVWTFRSLVWCQDGHTDIHVYIGIHVMFMFWVELPYCVQRPWSVKISRVQWRPIGKLNLYNRLCATHYQLTSCKLMTISWRYLSFDHWKSTAGNLLSNFHYCTIFLFIGVYIVIYFLEVLPCLLGY